MSGLAALDAKCSSRLGLITVSYYLWTTFVAVIVGIIMVSIIHPGGAAQKEDSEDSGKAIMSSADALLDLIRDRVGHFGRQRKCSTCGESAVQLSDVKGRGPRLPCVLFQFALIRDMSADTAASQPTVLSVIG
ncbi:hypothetical protein F2P81_025987 [Scophthalmus maximus]|uniref:Amino acid transporter n=1 Tax=Scophthalmus maximus TaxID=52904 RepID=A0A6A4RQV5_SCOMX|nr:hypothetical protein F2P81_025987 [Scophthalmus maximus]